MKYFAALAAVIVMLTGCNGGGGDVAKHDTGYTKRIDLVVFMNASGQPVEEVHVLLEDFDGNDWRPPAFPLPTANPPLPDEWIALSHVGPELAQPVGPGGLVGRSFNFDVEAEGEIGIFRIRCRVRFSGPSGPAEYNCYVEAPTPDEFLNAATFYLLPRETGEAVILTGTSESTPHVWGAERALSQTGE